MLVRLCRIAAMSVLATPALAQGSAVAQCSGIAEPAARLACYDAAQPPRSALPATPDASRYPEFNSSSRVQAPTLVPKNTPNEETASRGKLIAAVVNYSL